MNADSEVLQRLARESGRRLGELGVRPDDSRWIREEAETIVSLVHRSRSPGFLVYVRRLARKAARTAR